jgi:hypothetical protein
MRDERVAPLLIESHTLQASAFARWAAHYNDGNYNPLPDAIKLIFVLLKLLLRCADKFTMECIMDKRSKERPVNYAPQPNKNTASIIRARFTGSLCFCMCKNTTAHNTHRSNFQSYICMHCVAMQSVFFTTLYSKREQWR